MFLLFLLLVVFMVAYFFDKFQSIKAQKLAGYREKNPAQQLLWRLSKSDDTYLALNLFPLSILLFIGNLVFNWKAALGACIYFGLLDAWYVFTVIRNKRILDQR